MLLVRMAGHICTRHPIMFGLEGALGRRRFPGTQVMARKDKCMFQWTGNPSRSLLLVHAVQNQPGGLLPAHLMNSVSMQELSAIACSIRSVLLAERRPLKSGSALW